MLPLLQRNAPVHRTALLFAHTRPVRDLLERTLATAAHIIAQGRAAMAGAGTIGGNFQWRGRGVQMHGAGLYRWPGSLLQPGEPSQRLLVRGAAHLLRRLQAAAERRALRLPENRAAAVIQKLRATHPSRLALWHARQGRGNGGRDATGAAILSANQGGGESLSAFG